MKKGKLSWQLFLHLILGSFVILCIFPMILVVSISFSTDMEIIKHGYSVLPRGFTLAAYKMLFQESTQILTSYGVSAFVTVVGTVVSLWLTFTLAYVISRSDYAYSRITSFYVFVTMLFNGGLAATYIWFTKYLHLKDSILVLILPYLVMPYFVLLAKGFLQSIPFSIIESAKIDGSSEFNTFVKIVLPVTKSGIATMALFILLMYWNDWWLSLLYIDNSKIVSLQYLLYKMIKNAEYLSSSVVDSEVRRKIGDLPKISLRMAMCIVAAGPMLCIFPFFQKYLVKGITIGAIKG